MSELPSGTVTFLFTDIEGSTGLLQRVPEALPALLARHHAIVRRAIEAHGGYVFNIIGDAFCVAFRTAPDALDAAIDAQRALQAEPWDPEPVRVRMGCSTGAAQAGVLDDLAGGYMGYATLARAQRVMSVAQGGQILLSNASAELVRDNLLPGVALRDLGEHRLKGLVHAERLWQVVAPELRENFPPLQTHDTVPSNLPGALSPLVGRQHELSEVKARLAQARLLTLLGPGGTGKTRLALQVARDLCEDFGDRVYFVDLASSRDAEAALAAIARAIGLREKSDRPLLDDLKGQISDQRMLSLLDNFEQVTVAAPTMSELLRVCPELKMLVTSREALHVRGEIVFPVPPLALPHLDARRLSLEELATAESVQLFVARAQAVQPDFQLTLENAPAVVEICARLDGLPLAIELATARLNVFTPKALAERLGNRLKLLRGGARDLPARQQTLRDTMDWSYELLDAGEQDVFKLLALFSGATLEAVEAVAGQIPRFDDTDVFEAVGSLADKSLLRRTQDADSEPRLLMLETIREFAAARLAQDAGLQADARRAHATFYADFAREQWDPLRGEKRDDALAALTAELDNVQTAWHYWTAAGDREQLGKLTDSLWVLYEARGWYHATVELTSDLLRVLSTTSAAPERAHEEIILQIALARALWVTRGFTEEVEQAYARALELCDREGEVPQLFPVLRALSLFYTLRAQVDKGIQLGERILDLAQRLGDLQMEAEGHLIVGPLIGTLGDLRGGLAHLAMGLAGYDPIRARARRFGLGNNLGVVGLTVSALLSWMSGFPERALKFAGESIAVAQQLDQPYTLCYALFHCGLLNLWIGNAEVAREWTREVVDLADGHEFPVWRAVASCLRGAAMVRTGSADEGLALLDRNMQIYRGLKSPVVFWPFLLQIQAEAYGAAARPAEGLPLVDAAIEIASAGSGGALTSEPLRLKGELLLAIGQEHAEEAEGWLLRAMDTARQYEAPMLELRAALPLSRLWRDQGKTDAARDLLAACYAKFTEGFALPDLLRAQALLAELG